MNFRRCDELILSTTSWTEFQSKVSPLNETDKGDAFERLVQLHMQTDPLYVSEYEEVWHAKGSKEELPSSVRSHLNVPLTDEGIDLIARSRNGEYTAIQAKYRTDPNETYTWTKLSTFTSLTFRGCKNIRWGIVRNTTTKKIKKTKLEDEDVRFELLDKSLELDEDDGLGWKRIHTRIQGKEWIPPAPPPFPLVLSA